MYPNTLFLYNYNIYYKCPLNSKPLVNVSADSPSTNSQRILKGREMVTVQ